ncbi:hypothetical protein [Thalassotalea agarivorans]|uniref:Uncharacterized protein n=1 Tax=Thalassotalea agarivorans TaxID=349064 RepID=A0A1I0BVZ9_THASX|nr:hypothetical protein [Thalassotalea agarivorans]SET11178.1 hypothetical protein SAMN05660429_01071 [Thalassotalea agarivorans]
MFHLKNNTLSALTFRFTQPNDCVIAISSRGKALESVYFNHVLVSQKPCLLRRSIHTFMVGDIRYEVMFNYIDVAQDTLNCSLFKNAQLVDRQNSALKRIKARIKKVPI